MQKMTGIEQRDRDGPFPRDVPGAHVFHRGDAGGDLRRAQFFLEMELVEARLKYLGKKKGLVPLALPVERPDPASRRALFQAWVEETGESYERFQPLELQLKWWQTDVGDIWLSCRAMFRSLLDWRPRVSRS